MFKTAKEHQSDGRSGSFCYQTKVLFFPIHHFCNNLAVVIKKNTINLKLGKKKLKLDPYSDLRQDPDQY